MSSAQKRPEIPPQLEVLLTGINDNSQRMAVLQAYYSMAEGDPNTWPVQFALLIKAHTLAMNRFTEAAGSPGDRLGFSPPSPILALSSRSRRYSHSPQR